MTHTHPLAAADVAAYWNDHIHDLAVATAPVGSLPFFEQLDAYRFDKLRYLPRLVNFSAFREQRLLEVGCGAGIDLVRFAAGGAAVTGIDLASTSVELARTNLRLRGLSGNVLEMDGEALTFADASFDVVYAHGVLQYTVDPSRMVAEIVRVLRPGGTAIMMVYNRISWLNALSRLMRVELEHEDAPILRKMSHREFRALLAPFEQVTIIPERFPVRSRLHGGLKGWAFNNLFVTPFNLLPRRLVRPLGWHLMAFARKGQEVGA